MPPNMPNMPANMPNMPANMPANVPAVPQVITQDANTQKISGNSLADQLKTQNVPTTVKKTDDPAKAHDVSQANQTAIVPFAVVAVAASVMNDQKPIIGKGETENTQKAVEPASTIPTEGLKQTVMPQTLTPEMQRAWEDVKKFEFSVETDNSRPAA